MIVMTVLLPLFLINLVLAWKAVHSLKTCRTEVRYILFFLPIVFPVVGWLLLLLFAGGLLKQLEPSAEVQELNRRESMNSMLKRPKLEEELNVVPVTDAMAASPVREKRRLLLNQMKQDQTNRYQLLISAASDQDTETAHYASALKMEMYTLYQNELHKKQDSWEQDASDENRLELLKKLDHILNSGLLSEYEFQVQSEKFCQILEDMPEQNDLPVELFDTWLNLLLQQKNYTKIRILWKEHWKSMESENGLSAALRSSLCLKDRDFFEEVLDYFKHHEELIESAEAQEKLRFWEKWRLDNAFN